jgi:uncharacterized membrane protein YccC
VVLFVLALRGARWAYAVFLVLACVLIGAVIAIVWRRRDDKAALPSAV